MKRRLLIALLITTTLGLGTIAQAAETKEKTKKQTTCPVMGGKINKAQFVDVNGYRIYVCCPGCIGKIKSDPDKYINKMKAEGVTLDKTPKKDTHKHHKDDGHKH